MADSEVRELVESGRVGFPNIQKAFESLTGAGGKFAGLMEAQSQSFDGLMSTMKDSANNAMREFGKAIIERSGLKDAIRAATAGMESLMPAASIAAASICNVLGGQLSALMPRLQSITAWIANNPAIIQAKVSSVMQAITNALGTFQRSAAFVIDHGQKIAYVLGAAVLGVAATKAVESIAAIIAQLGLLRGAMAATAAQAAVTNLTPGGGKGMGIVGVVNGALAQYERSLIRERVLAGLESAKRRGKRGGRPCRMDDEKITAAVTLFDQLGMAISSTARPVGVPRSTLVDALKRAGRHG